MPCNADVAGHTRSVSVSLNASAINSLDTSTANGWRLRMFDAAERTDTTRPIDAAAIRADAEAMFAASDDQYNGHADGNNGLFKIRTASDWIGESQKRPAPKMLFGEFWFEGEICILFADTNTGKSILAVQIADAISRGRAIDGLPLGTNPQTVIYFDFELSDKQFEARYSEKRFGSEYFSNPFQFHSNLLRAEIDADADIDHGFADFEAYLHISLSAAIVSTGSRVLIIDNLTYLKNETERARDALPLMKYLKRLKSRYDLSILALAHTPKRDHSKPITRNDLQGSKMLINFCDSSFAIGESCKDAGLRYLKQIKVRNAEMRYDSENVYLCQIVKPDNFLRFEFKGFGSEREHLRVLSDGDRENLIARAKTLSETGQSQREIANELGISVSTANKYIRC